MIDCIVWNVRGVAILAKQKSVNFFFNTVAPLTTVRVLVETKRSASKARNSGMKGFKLAACAEAKGSSGGVEIWVKRGTKTAAVATLGSRLARVDITENNKKTQG